MKFSQNERILQVSNEKLVVGIDVASEIHYARTLITEVLSRLRHFGFSNNREGFESFVKWADVVRVKGGGKDTIIELELTGHYCFNLAQYIKNPIIKIVLVNHFAVKCSKELDDNNPDQK